MEHAARPGSAALTASALVLAGLVILQAGRWGGGGGWGEARADMVSRIGTYTAMTADIGNEEGLFVLDGRSEELLIYKVQNQNSVELLRRYQLPRIFADARARATGGGGGGGGR